jgi:tubulin-specific chaperone B
VCFNIYSTDAGRAESYVGYKTVTEIELGITLNARCQLLPEADSRRGTVSFIGLVPSIPGVGPWIGITLDEPTGKNDGSLNGNYYFSCAPKHGVFVRPDRVEVGDFPALGLEDENMEEV